VLVAGSLSKTYAMTGWRIGFGLAPARVIGAMLKLQSHSTSNPTSIAQKARGGSPARSAGFRGYHAGGVRQAARLRHRAAARDSGRALCRAAGAFYAYPNIGVAFRNGISSTLQFAEKLLDKAAVAVVPGEAFGTDRHVRISYATSMHELERGLDRLHRFIVEQ
jgi:aspartate aminotransferase